MRDRAHNSLPSAATKGKAEKSKGKKIVVRKSGVQIPRLHFSAPGYLAFLSFDNEASMDGVAPCRINPARMMRECAYRA